MRDYNIPIIVVQEMDHFNNDQINDLINDLKNVCYDSHKIIYNYSRHYTSKRFKDLTTTISITVLMPNN